MMDKPMHPDLAAQKFQKFVKDISSMPAKHPWTAKELELKVSIQELEQQLTAEREAREKAEQQRDAWALLAKQNEQLASEAIQRAEAAEQLIKDSQNQKPLEVIHITNAGGYITDTVRLPPHIKVYAATIPPAQPEPCLCVTNINDTDPETGEKKYCTECNGTGTIPLAGVAELQRQVEFWKHSSEEWKLAYAALGGTASNSGKEELTRMFAELQKRNAELTRKLENRDDYIRKMNDEYWNSAAIDKVLEEARKQEREECVKICEGMAIEYCMKNPNSNSKELMSSCWNQAAAAIRAKGN